FAVLRRPLLLYATALALVMLAAAGTSSLLTWQSLVFRETCSQIEYGMHPAAVETLLGRKADGVLYCGRGWPRPCPVILIWEGKAAQLGVRFEVDSGGQLYVSRSDFYPKPTVFDRLSASLGW